MSASDSHIKQRRENLQLYATFEYEADELQRKKDMKEGKNENAQI